MTTQKGTIFMRNNKNKNETVPAKNPEDRNLVWRKDRQCYACRWMFDGEIKQQTLKDDKGNLITDVVKARAERDKLLAPYALKEQEDVLAILKARAERKRDQALKISDEANPPLKIADAWKKYSSSVRRPDSGESTMARYHSQYKRFNKWVAKEYPNINYMRDVNEDIAERYATDLKSVRYSPNNINKHIATLRLLWRTLHREIRANGSNPWLDIAHLKVPRKDNSRRAISPEQFTAVLTHADSADLHDLMFTLGWTGQRLVDIVTLKWMAISYSRSVIELVPRKTSRRTGAKVAIPLLPQLETLLKKRQENATSNLVFPELADVYERNPSIITRRIQDAFSKAKLDPREKRSRLKRAVAVYGAHSLRHFFVTEAMAAGWPADLIRKITGHTSEAMAQHYQHVDAGLIARLAGQLNDSKKQNVPALPEGTMVDPAEELRKKVTEIASKLTAKNAAIIRKELLALAGTATTGV
jgi:site-specific recombinase XerD